MVTPIRRHSPRLSSACRMARASASSTSLPISVSKMTGTDCAAAVRHNAAITRSFHGLPVFEVANLLGIDAGTLGNHDFDYGWMQTRKFMEVAKYPIVSGNVVGATGELFSAKPYVILKVNGLRVAVLGAMTDEL